MSRHRTTMTRRELGLCLGSAIAMVSARGARDASAPWAGPARVKVLYRQSTDPGGPSPVVDLNREKTECDARLAELEKLHSGEIRFTGSVVVSSAINDAQLTDGQLKELQEADAILLLDQRTTGMPLLDKIASAGRPILIFTRPLSGWTYITGAAAMRAGKKVDMVASSDFSDLAPFFPMLRAIRHVRNSKVLVLSPDAARRRSQGEEFTRSFGTAISFMGYKDLRDLYSSAGSKQAAQEADEFTRGALRVIEPKPADIHNALRMYLAVQKLLERERANAITVDCLAGFRRGDMPAYPCVAWSKLNDMGMYGVCEADLQSTMTQILVTGYSGRPGFVSDPTFDTSRNEVIHAHCAAATRMLGIGGAASPYLVRTHMEDEKGVSMQVLMPVRETVTVGVFRGPSRFLVSTAEVKSNLESVRGCRTKIVTRVADARKMVEGYSGGLHRVVFYGDFVQPIERMGRLMGFQTVREG